MRIVELGLRSKRNVVAPAGAGALSFCLALSLLACGGSAHEDPKTPANETASESATPTTTTTETGPTTTTTATLGESGDLQGAKLGSASSTTVETKTSGPKASGDGEPGRRVDDIRTIIGTRREEARKCYDDALKDHPGIEGDVDLKWVIDPKGNVTDISVDESKSTIHEPQVGKCIIGIIQKIKFAESPKGFESRMHYPFNFHPKGTQVKAGSTSQTK